MLCSIPVSARLPLVSLSPRLGAEHAPVVPLTALDTVWFQLTGTFCNIACRHCFITCGPKETRVPMMDAARVRRFLDEAEALGARDYYFTGGEPMLHPEFWPLSTTRSRAGRSPCSPTASSSTRRPRRARAAPSTARATRSTCASASTA